MQVVRYCIRPEEAALLYARSPRFRRLLGSGRFIYLQGRFCLAKAPWCSREGLSARAISHPEKCCIGFRTVWLRPGVRIPHVANRQSHRCGLELCSMPEGFSEALLRQEAEVNFLLKGLPADFSGSARLLMERTGYTRRMMAEAMGIDEKTLYRFLYNPTPSRHMVFAFGFAIHAAAPLFDELVRKAGYGYAATKEDNLVQLVRGIAPNPGLAYCNKILRDGGCSPLTERA